MTKLKGITLWDYFAWDSYGHESSARTGEAMTILGGTGEAMTMLG